MVTVYFLHGHVIAMHPAPEKTYYDSRQQIYDCDIIISDGKRYDLQDKSQIQLRPLVHVPRNLVFDAHAVNVDQHAVGVAQLHSF